MQDQFHFHTQNMKEGKKLQRSKKKKKKLKRRKTTSANKTSCEVIKVEYSQRLDTANTVKILALL